MNTAESDKLFSGSIPKLYDDYLVPLIFQPYAQDLVGRLASRKPARVLEIAAGTGVVTRLLASTLPASAAIVATDLNRPMLELAAAVGTSRPVQWREADAMQLPFGKRLGLVGKEHDAELAEHRIELAVAARSTAASPRLPAIAYCQGTPLRNEIESRGPGRLAQATDLAEAALALRFGAGPVDGKIQAHVVAVERASNS
jgi:SAM-dependent methyltransferase